MKKTDKVTENLEFQTNEKNKNKHIEARKTKRFVRILHEVKSVQTYHIGLGDGGERRQMEEEGKTLFLWE